MITDEMVRAHCRIDRILHLKSMVHPSDEFGEFVEECDPDDFRKEFPAKRLAQILKASDGDVDEAFDSLLESGLKGLLGKVSVPVPEFPLRGKPLVIISSWGCTTWRWFYAETLDELERLALGYTRERLEVKLAKGKE